MKGTMLGARWYKVLGDLWGNKTRTLLVVISIAVGVFAIGMIAGSRVIILRGLADSYAAVGAAGATLATDPFGDDLIAAVHAVPGVRQAEGRHTANVRLDLGAGDWRDAVLVAIPDYHSIRINRVFPEQGAWPPPRGEILIERASLSYMQASSGDAARLEMADGAQHQLRIAGTAYDLNPESTHVSGVIYGYVTFDTLEDLGGGRDFNQLLIAVAGDSADKEHIQRIAASVRDTVEQTGRQVYLTFVPEPGKFWANDAVRSMLLLLGVLGVLALFMSGFLVVNTISALLAQQVRHIGVMKAIGGNTRQMVGLYVVTVLIYGLLSLVVAVPLGAIAALSLIDYSTKLLNFNSPGFRIPPEVLALQAAAALLVPIAAALFPIIAGSRITVREAISSQGLGEHNPVQRVSNRVLAGMRALSSPALLAIGNPFRRPGRLLLTLTTLTLAGAIFIAVLSVRTSLMRTLDDAFKYQAYDAQFTFDQPYPVEDLEREALGVPGVVQAESWGFSAGHRLRSDRSESDTILVTAPPATTNLIQPGVLEGRWLRPGDTQAAVINTEVLRDEPDIAVGDMITLVIGGRETRWQVVGLVQGILAGPLAYVPYPAWAGALDVAGRASRVQVVTEQHSAEAQARVARTLEERFKAAGLRVRSTQTTARQRALTESNLNIIVVFLLVMAILLAMVGGLGLMGMMSINVLERTREIGIMRSIGAQDGAVLRIVMVEGLICGALSWVLGALLAIPLSRRLAELVGVAFLNGPLSYTFGTGGVLLWLALVLVLASLASFLPAWNASRLTVRDVLAYE